MVFDHCLILDSRKPEAKKFRRWITSEVLPSLRKDGVYVTEELAGAIITLIRG
ncbi:BRO-N domain-containing protein [Corynebacterium flavescens]|uniref:BRO-N domain-containing protein n=1 Tax=Corynebacterium flavescens TaxID=28028 RepID=UPI0026479C56|nr:BRO family protein [Corynebacterium flavescens]